MDKLQWDWQDHMLSLKSKSSLWLFVFLCLLQAQDQTEDIGEGLQAGRSCFPPVYGCEMWVFYHGHVGSWTSLTWPQLDWPYHKSGCPALLRQAARDARYIEASLVQDQLRSMVTPCFAPGQEPTQIFCSKLTSGLTPSIKVASWIKTPMGDSLCSFDFG